LGLVKATLHFAMQDPALAQATKEFIANQK